MRKLLSAFVLGAVILLLGAPSALAQTEVSSGPDDASQLPSLSPSGFTLADYRELKARDTETAQLVLVAMREAVFYAQKSVGKPVLCASPMPIPGPRLVAMFDEEIATPTNPSKRPYDGLDHAAYILMFALRAEGACQ
jgi:hypothetical protein